MSADLHIHVLEYCTKRDVMLLKCNSLGSKYFNLNLYHKRPDDIYEKLEGTPNVWVGEVSWLKADLFEDRESFIPDTIQQVRDLVGEDFPVITDEFIEKISKTFDVPNTTGYNLAKRESVTSFLKQHKGKKVFCVSW